MSDKSNTVWHHVIHKKDMPQRAGEYVIVEPNSTSLHMMRWYKQSGLAYLMTNPNVFRGKLHQDNVLADCKRIMFPTDFWWAEIDFSQFGITEVKHQSSIPFLKLLNT